MNLSYYIQQLPAELQNKILTMSCQGRTYKIFNDFIKSNELFKYNFCLQTSRFNNNYTLYRYLKDCKLLKAKAMFTEGMIFDIDDMLEFILNNHMADYDSSTDDSEPEFDSESD